MANQIAPFVGAYVRPPEVPKIAFGFRRIWPSVSLPTACMSRYLSICQASCFILTFVIYNVVSNRNVNKTDRQTDGHVAMVLTGRVDVNVVAL